MMQRQGSSDSTGPGPAAVATVTGARPGALPEALDVAIVSPEIVPFAKTGGLGDVLGALPPALERLGLRLCLFMPAYRSVLTGGFPLEDTGVRFSVPISGHRQEGSLFKTVTGSAIPVYLVRADRYFDRDYLYTTPDADYPDNAERFTFFARAVLEVLRKSPPRLLHVHDWQSALAAVFLKTQPQLYPELASTRTVLTIHNLGYQGLFSPEHWPTLSLERRFFTPDYLEFFGKINFLKGGLVFADAITTVSPAYAEEIKTAEQGFGLEGVLRRRAADLAGILNGVDYSVWDPETDPFIAQNYGPRNLAGKRACKTALQQAFGLPLDADVPLAGMVSRLTAQKGLDLLREALDGLLSRGLQFVLVGVGETSYQQFFNRLPLDYPGQVGVKLAFDEPLAHRAIASADIFFLPSRYEPGGLVQLYSLKYGTVPVVRATGGLKDTVEEFDPDRGTGNGFVFRRYQAEDFLAAVDRAIGLFHQRDKWAVLMGNAMAADFSWGRSARAYLDLYRKLGLEVGGAAG
ncbi:MAG: glycogen synthase GlgA [Chloroflexi bacterium]|nr:glycogen synthase GlgA [Chloroflexota bacterium]